MKTIFQFFFATYLFSKGYRKVSAIGNALRIHPGIISTWAATPFWQLALHFWGHTGNPVPTGVTKWEKKHIAKIQKERLEKLKSELLRQNGVLPNDLNAAENQWSKMIFKGDL